MDFIAADVERRDDADDVAVRTAREEQEFGVETNVVDVYIGYLRKKIDGLGETPLIQTIRGVGYALREP